MTFDRVPIPPQVRGAVLHRAGGRCEDCGERLPLELHHLRYWLRPGYPSLWEPVPTPIFGRETVEDLAALCRDCHHSRHLDPAGEFWVDPEDMDEHWAPYRWEMDKL
jgi:5-methylcytosine-specific restriction endonuclease McrA